LLWGFAFAANKIVIVRILPVVEDFIPSSLLAFLGTALGQTSYIIPCCGSVPTFLWWMVSAVFTI
jgi:hypothetical protein